MPLVNEPEKVPLVLVTRMTSTVAELIADVGRLAILELIATALTHNLHVDATLVEFDKFVAGDICGSSLKHELVFVDHNNTVIRHELGDGIALLLFLVAVGLIVVATGENENDGHAYQYYFFHVGCKGSKFLVNSEWRMGKKLLFLAIF